jgi:hypothetical protein
MQTASAVRMRRIGTVLQGVAGVHESSRDCLRQARVRVERSNRRIWREIRCLRQSTRECRLAFGLHSESTSYSRWTNGTWLVSTVQTSRQLVGLVNAAADALLHRASPPSHSQPKGRGL